MDIIPHILGAGILDVTNPAAPTAEWLIHRQPLESCLLDLLSSITLRFLQTALQAIYWFCGVDGVCDEALSTQIPRVSFIMQLLLDLGLLGTKSTHPWIRTHPTGPIHRITGVWRIVEHPEGMISAWFASDASERVRYGISRGC